MSSTENPTIDGAGDGDTASAPPPDDTLPTAGRESRRPRLVILLGVVVVALLVVGLHWRAASQTNHHALAQDPKPVTVVRAKGVGFRQSRSYVGTIASWNQANVGPQYVSAYVGTVLVRPGAVVKRGEILGTLDCRNASAASREIAARAKALEEQRTAVAHETERLTEMKKGGFASENEVEQVGARASSQAAEVESLKAALTSRTLEVDDCILRAPFAGEVADRFVDPGAYVRPGNPVVTVVDRNQVRIVADAPESDFAVVAPETPVLVDIEATGAKLTAKVSRRSPSADETTRTVHFEIDVPNAGHLLPVNATARLTIEVGNELPATEVPLRTATVRGQSATVFTVDGDRARRVTVPLLGERGGSLYLDRKLAPETEVVIEGRALLDDGDPVRSQEAPAP